MCFHTCEFCCRIRTSDTSGNAHSCVSWSVLVKLQWHSSGSGYCPPAVDMGATGAVIVRNPGMMNGSCLIISHDLNKDLEEPQISMKTIALLLLAASAISILGSTGVAFAQDGASSGDSMKLLGAGLAFGIAAGGAGIGLGQVGAAGLAVISENPALQSKVFIFVGMVESIAIYGIVMMFIILGQ